jgi:hypothetical protein
VRDLSALTDDKRDSDLWLTLNHIHDGRCCQLQSPEQVTAFIGLAVARVGLTVAISD